MRENEYDCPGDNHPTIQYGMNLETKLFLYCLAAKAAVVTSLIMLFRR